MIKILIKSTLKLVIASPAFFAGRGNLVIPAKPPPTPQDCRPRKKHGLAMTSLRLILRKAFIITICSFLSSHVFSEPIAPSFGTNSVFIPQSKGVRTELLKNIAPIIQKSIAEHYYPGAVILVSHHGKIIYRGVFGHQRLLPDTAPMHFNTIFDLASLTKVIATAPAIMQLIEQSKLSLDDPVAKYWPAFAENGKEKITIRELLTHESGLPADIEPTDTMLQDIEKISVYSSPKKFVYSDINFIVLAHVVEIISGEPFAEYTQKHIFQPLGMHHTFFMPLKNGVVKNRIAPTDIINHQLRWGEVEDPSATALGGVAGNAGLFSDAKDLSIYAQSLLNGGKIPGKKAYFLGPLSVAKMTTPETPLNEVNVRGLGWDMDSAYSNRGVLFPIQSYGHTGWTGTSIWIDPVTQTYIIILTNRTHPQAAAHNQLIEDRNLIANIVAASITDVVGLNQQNTGVGELSRGFRG